jgi:prophage regulatory protein
MEKLMNINASTDGFTRVEKVAKRYDTTTKSIWRWAKQGTFPKPYKLTAGVTAWKNSELAEWEQDPMNYRVKT